MNGETVRLEIDKGIARLRLDRPEAGNAINARMVADLDAALTRCAAEGATILVLEGSAESFCAGGDFEATASGETLDPAALYDLWRRLAEGPFVSVALVRGRANAGGVGLAAACDIVLADRSASFGLSEMLFGLFPACVLPFLARRIGAQKAHYMTLMTRPLPAEEAASWGLVDALDDEAEALLRRHLQRLRHLGRPAIARYKAHRAGTDDTLARGRDAALAANREMFADPEVQRNIRRYVTEMKFPWEG